MSTCPHCGRRLDLTGIIAAAFYKGRRSYQTLPPVPTSPRTLQKACNAVIASLRKVSLSNSH